MTQTKGSIIKIINTGDEVTVTVKYVVDHHLYTIKETVVMKKVKKLGFIPTKKKVPSIGTLRAGHEVNVCYDEENPEKAYLLDNH